MQRVLPGGQIADGVFIVDPVTGLPSGGAASEATLGQIKASLDAINVNTDLVETLQANTNTALTTLQGDVDSVEPLLTDIKAALLAFPQAQALTDTQLRASAVPVSIASMPSTPVTGTFWQSTQPVSGPLTDTQLRAAPVSTSAALAKPVARYVFIARPASGGSWFVLNEVEVMVGGVNRALLANNPARTVTAYQNASIAGNAVNGNTADGDWYSSGGGNTDGTVQWWQVDLGADYAVDSVKVTCTSGGGATNSTVILSPSSTGPLSNNATISAAMAKPGAFTLGTVPTTPVTGVNTFLVVPTNPQMELLRASIAAQADTQASVKSLLPQLGGRLSVEPLGVFSGTGVKAGAATSAASTAQALTAGARVLMHADVAGPVYFAFGASATEAQTRANTADARIRVGQGQCVDIRLASNLTYCAWIRAGSADSFAQLVTVT